MNNERKKCGEHSKSPYKNKILNTPKIAERIKASDTGVPGPGAPVADLSANGGRATGNDPGNPLENDFGTTIDLPLSGQIQCQWCFKGGKDIRFLQETQFIKHRDSQHPDGKITWRCAACLKCFEKIHGCRCHLPKCKGPQNNKGVAKFNCGSCEESFLSQRGLSMHELHRHPAIRNAKRAQSTNRGNVRPVTRASVWSKEETDLLKILNERYKHLKQPNVALKEYFPDKTLKQISDKRRLLPAQEPQDVANNEKESDSRQSPSDSSEESIYESATEEEEGEYHLQAAQTSWKEPLKQIIITNHLEEGNPLRDVEKEIKCMAEEESITEEKTNILLQKFIDTLLEGVPGSQSKKEPKQKNNKRNTHNKRKRFQYAKHQELYKKSPRKLLDLALIKTKASQWSTSQGLTQFVHYTRNSGVKRDPKMVSK